jgi:hypothetical protein
MPYDGKKSYTVQEMADYIANEAGSGTELIEILAANGFELKSDAVPSGEDTGTPLEVASTACGGSPVAVVEEPMLVVEESPVSAPPIKKRPGIDLVALRLSASKKALNNQTRGH